MNNEIGMDERTPMDLGLFAFAGIGFLWGVTGIIVGSTAVAIAGALIFLGSVSLFALRPAPGE
jgi:hypothetical protein